MTINHSNKTALHDCNLCLTIIFPPLQFQLGEVMHYLAGWKVPVYQLLCSPSTRHSALAYSSQLFSFKLSGLEKLIKLESLNTECIPMTYIPISETQWVFLTALPMLVLHNKIHFLLEYFSSRFSYDSKMLVC